MGKAVITLQYKAHTAPTGYRQIEQALLDTAHLYNAIDHADANAAENIRIQGQKLLGRADEDLASSEDERPCAGTTTARGLRAGSQTPASGRARRTSQFTVR